MYMEVCDECHLPLTRTSVPSRDPASAVGTVSPGLAIRPRWSGSSLFSLLPLRTWLTHHMGRAGP